MAFAAEVLNFDTTGPDGKVPQAIASARRVLCVGGACLAPWAILALPVWPWVGP